MIRGRNAGRAAAGALAGALAWTLAVSGASAADPIVVLTNPGSVAWAMRDLGYRARLGADDDGHPEIESGAGGLGFVVRFYGCDGEASCAGVLFEVGFDLTDGMGHAEINDWNARSFVGRAYLDHECDPYLDHYLHADPEMDQSVFATVVQDWAIAMNDFSDTIGFGEDRATDGIATCDGASEAI